MYRCAGGFAILDRRTEADELDDFERIEISLAGNEQGEGLDQSTTSTHLNNESDRSADDQL